MLPKQRFDQARPFLTLGLVVVGWLIVPVVIKAFLRASFFEFQAPISNVASYARDVQEYWALRLHSRRQLIEAGRDLGRLTSSYEAGIQQNESLRNEIKRLESLLRLPPYPEFRPEHARVVRRDFNGWWQRLVIRKGGNDITVGAPVIFSGGLVGRISEVHAYTSVVELISSPSVRVTAVVDGDIENWPISFQGGINPPFSPPRGAIEFVPLGVNASANSPVRLITSGLGGVFPPGLLIGRITKVETSTDGLFKTGEVELDPRLSTLTEVTVLVPVNVE